MIVDIDISQNKQYYNRVHNSSCPSLYSVLPTDRVASDGPQTVYLSMETELASKCVFTYFIFTINSVSREKNLTTIIVLLKYLHFPIIYISFPTFTHLLFQEICEQTSVCYCHQYETVQTVCLIYVKVKNLIYQSETCQIVFHFGMKNKITLHLKAQCAGIVCYLEGVLL